MESNSISFNLSMHTLYIYTYTMCLLMLSEYIGPSARAAEELHASPWKISSTRCNGRCAALGLRFLVPKWSTWFMNAKG